jgi:hypothetical protein
VTRETKLEEMQMAPFEAIQKHITINLFWMLLGGGEDYIGTDRKKKTQNTTRYTNIKQYYRQRSNR